MKFIVKLLKFLFQRYLTLCDVLTRFAGHCFGPQFHYLWAAVPVVLFAYGYVSGMTLQYYPDLLIFMLLVSLPFVIVVHWALHGTFHRFGIRSIFPLVNRINNMYDGILLKQGYSLQEYDRLLKDLTKLPILRMVTSLLDVFIFLIPTVTYEFTVRGLTNLTAYLQAIAVTIPNLMFFSYLTTDLHMSRSRSQVRKKIYNLSGSFSHYYAFSLRRKFIIILFLIALSGYLLISLMSSQVKISNNGSIFSNIIVYAIIALINLAFLMGLFIYNIFQAIYTLEKMSHSLRLNKSLTTFSGTADKELCRLSDGIFSAAQKLLRYQKELEEKVQERTHELLKANEILQQQQEIMEKELKMAAEIQQSMFANTATSWNQLRFAALTKPMVRVSGDYYDIFRQEDFVYIIVADVSGHGVPAALITIGAKQAFQEAIKETPSPAQVCYLVNSRLLDQIKTQEYLTAFVIRIDTKNKVLYCNAGHTKALWFRKAKLAIQELDTGGMFLGAIEVNHSTFQDGALQLAKGDRLFLYTDGLVECDNQAKEPFGIHRVKQLITSHVHLPIDELNELILQELAKFSGSSHFKDDVTMLFVEVS